MSQTAEQIPAMILEGKLIELAGHLNAAVEEFMAQELAATNNTPTQVQATANDILYKYMIYPYATFGQEAKDQLNPGEDWQSSEGLVYQVRESNTAIIKLNAHLKQIARTARPDEDKKGYVALSEKAAKELGYTTLKALS
jgi:signal recognition particle subunit SEC65